MICRQMWKWGESYTCVKVHLTHFLLHGTQISREEMQKDTFYSRKIMWPYYVQERLEHYGLHSCHIWVRWLFLSWLFKGTCTRQLGCHIYLQLTIISSLKPEQHTDISSQTRPHVAAVLILWPRLVTPLFGYME